jgi:hypothetical protein
MTPFKTPFEATLPVCPLQGQQTGILGSLPSLPTGTGRPAGSVESGSYSHFKMVGLPVCRGVSADSLFSTARQTGKSNSKEKTICNH